MPFKIVIYLYIFSAIISVLSMCLHKSSDQVIYKKTERGWVLTTSAEKIMFILFFSVVPIINFFTAFMVVLIILEGVVESDWYRKDRELKILSSNNLNLPKEP